MGGGRLWCIVSRFTHAMRPMRLPERQSARLALLERRNDDSAAQGMPEMHLPVYNVRADRAHRAARGEEGRHARVLEPREADGRLDQGLRETARLDGAPRPRGGGDLDRSPQGPSQRGALRVHRREGDGQAPPDRSGGLRPLRFRLPAVRERQRVHRRDPIPLPPRRSRHLPAPPLQGMSLCC